MLSIDAKFAVIIITHASAAIYGPMLSPLSPLSPVSFQLDEDVFQELVDLWATVSAITFSQIFCNDCSIYSVVWNGMSLPFFLGYQIVHCLLFISPATGIRAFSYFYSVITEFCDMGESTFDAADFDYRETSSNASSNTIHLPDLRIFRYFRDVKVASVLNVPILIDYAETACCEACPSSDFISNRVPLTTFHGRTTSHAVDTADPYDISFGSFFAVAERSLLLQQEFFLLASCIVAILSDDISSVDESISSVHYTSDDVSDLVPSTITNGGASSFTADMSDPYDTSIGIFFDVAECGLVSQQEFFLLANCIAATLSGSINSVRDSIRPAKAICSISKPIRSPHESPITALPTNKSVHFVESRTTILFSPNDIIVNAAGYTTTAMGLESTRAPPSSPETVDVLEQVTSSTTIMNSESVHVPKSVIIQEPLVGPKKNQSSERGTAVEPTNIPEHSTDIKSNTVAQEAESEPRSTEEPNIPDNSTDVQSTSVAQESELVSNEKEPDTPVPICFEYEAEETDEIMKILDPVSKRPDGQACANIFCVTPAKESPEQEDTIEPARLLAIFNEAMGDAYKILSRDQGQFNDVPTDTLQEKVLYNIFVTKKLLKTIILFSEQLTTSRGARVEGYTRSSNVILGKDPMKALQYYCYNFGIDAVEAHRSENPEASPAKLRRLFEITVRTYSEDLFCKTMYEQMFDSYVFCVHSTQRGYEEVRNDFEQDISHILLKTNSNVTSMSQWITYLDEVSTKIRQGTPYNFVPSMRVVRAYYYLKDCFDDCRMDLKPRVLHEKDFCDFIEWAADNNDLKQQHTYCKSMTEQYDFWCEDTFKHNVRYLRKKLKRHLPKREHWYSNLKSWSR